MQRYENHAIFVALRAYFFNILYYRKLLLGNHLLRIFIKGIFIKGIIFVK